jgi:hypothetical protein
VVELAREAKRFDLNLTIDAEEADRLELSLEVMRAAFADPSLAGWDGFGLAVQAYGKRALAVIDWSADLAQGLGRRMMIRLVKGAYWDTEVKRAQERGLDDYPVFTRKAMTDLSYVACAERLLQLRPHCYPQFATHNALTVAAVLERAGEAEGFEFQRLHGMGEALTAACSKPCRTPPAGSMLRSASTATSSPTLCAGCLRTAPIRRSSPLLPTRRAGRSAALAPRRMRSADPRPRATPGCRCHATCSRRSG